SVGLGRFAMTINQMKPSRVSRRDFMKVAGVGAAAPVLGSTILVSDASAETWDSETDVVSVGSGGAALASAGGALQNKATVAVLERGPAPGGTTAKSGGAYWIPNSPFMQAAGLADPKDDAIRYMARVAWPSIYRADSPTLGLPKSTYDL